MKAILYFCVITLCVACQSSDKDKQGQERNKIVKATTVKSQTATLLKEFSFIAQPFRLSQLSFRVGGPISHFDVYAGSYYPKGAIIAEIDARDFQIRLQKAEAVYTQAKAEFERINILYAKNNIAVSAYEKAKTEYTSAEMAFKTAKNELNDTKLTAPFNGYVSEVFIEKHQDIKATQSVISFADIDQLKIEVYVTQDIAYHSQKLKEVELRFDALPDKIYTAKILEVSKNTTPNNLSYVLTAILPNRDRELLAGMSGKVCFSAPSIPGQKNLTIPQIAICHRPSEGDYIWVINTENQKVSKRKIKIGALLTEGNVLILEGVNEGELVAVSSLRFLSEGMKIDILQK